MKISGTLATLSHCAVPDLNARGLTQLSRADPVSGPLQACVDDSRPLPRKVHEGPEDATTTAIPCHCSCPQTTEALERLIVASLRHRRPQPFAHRRQQVHCLPHFVARPSGLVTVDCEVFQVERLVASIDVASIPVSSFVFVFISLFFCVCACFRMQRLASASGRQHRVN